MNQNSFASTSPYSFLGERTHLCGTLTSEHLDKVVTLAGWVRRQRDHGGLVFVDIGDYSGVCQLVFGPESAEAFSLAEQLRSEYVISVKGRVRLRPEGTINQARASGEIEVLVEQAEILAAAETPPFLVDNYTEAKEELRLKYRFLDLRRQEMQDILRLRHSVCRVARNYLDELNFCEIETPILTKPTPEGARDFLVPSRLSPGMFYALPQSPQLFKQVLMCSGMDRYYQIVRCFRDEDFRANRQPEFTQIDIEMSFISESNIIELIEGLMARIWKECVGIELPLPFPRLSYDDVMSRFGVDAPDLRYGMEIENLADIFSNSSFQVFSTAQSTGGDIKGVLVNGGAGFSRRELDNLTELAKNLGSKGLCWLKVENSEFKSPIAKHLTDGEKQALFSKFHPEEGDIILILADSPQVVQSTFASIRSTLAKQLNLVDPSKLAFTWVERFPLFQFDAHEGRYVAVHHPFTAPALAVDELQQLESNPQKVYARAYDLVLNGQEIAGGSIRIHRADVQKRVFSLLGISEEEARRKFGFLLDALSFGAPPHGGIAVGLDRLIMIISGRDSIRDVIAFPKTSKGVDLMVDAPSTADVHQLVELGIQVRGAAIKPS